MPGAALVRPKGVAQAHRAATLVVPEGLARIEAQQMLAAGDAAAAQRGMLLSLFERDEAVRFLASG